MIFNQFQTLRVQDGEINKIDSHAFSGLPNLTTLLINNCDLKKPPQLNPLKRNLISLSLNYNSICDFPLEYFHGFLSLEIFGVGWNSLSSIPSVNELASHLSYLMLMSNQITDVVGRWRENDTVYARLTVLQLEGNNITSIDAGIVKALPSIKVLYLAKNSIKHFEDPTRYVDGISWNCQIDLSKNPLDCGSHLSWVASLQQVAFDGTCNTPGCVNGTALHAMSEYISGLILSLRPANERRVF